MLGLGTYAEGLTAQQATPAPEPTSAASSTPEGAFAAIHGVELYYEVHGEKDSPPVLLVHGGLGNTEEFDGLVPNLVAAGYRTVALDCRGRGRSSWDGAAITYELMADDALALLDLLGIERADFVGWSDGAIIGLELAIHHPDRLNRAVIYGANFTPDGVYAEPQPSEQLPPFEKFIADYQRLSPQPERFDELLEELGAMWQVAPNYSEANLKSITVPVLILDGAEEELVKPDQPVRMAELIPGAELVLIPDTGHFAPFAKRDEFNRIVLTFLQG
jgi:pimeloyl-ACP methyl ester carboxylesterase